MATTLPQLQVDHSQRRQTSTDQQTLVYLAAAYTKPDPVENTHAVLKIADAVLDAGFIPLIPHLTLAWHLVSPKRYETWLEYDRQLLMRCDAVLRIPGYSNGATQECSFADECGIPVIRPFSNSPSDCVSALTLYFSH